MFQVSCTDAIFQIIRANAHKMRVFALGIGDGASHGSITGIARAGCGTAAFVTYNESMDEKVLDQLKNALQPCLTEIHLEWEGLTSIPEKPIPVLNKMKTLLGYNKPIETDNELTSDSLPRVEQSPETIPPVFDGSQLLVFGLFRNDCPKSVLITAQSPDGPLSARVEVIGAIIHFFKNRFLMFLFISFLHPVTLMVIRTYFFIVSRQSN